MKFQFGLCLAAMFALFCANSMAGEIGFIETFSLAEDRDDALRQLIPGTEDYYFYHCLHAQHTGRHAEARELLAQWIRRHGDTARAREMRNRQALFDYASDPGPALEHLRNELDLRFDHQRETPHGEAGHPTRLDPALIERQTLARRALARHGNSLRGFEDRALASLAETPLTPDQRRELLQRLRRPDVKGLAERVVEDLRHRNSGGFGSLPIHSQLLWEQLVECRRRMPELAAHHAFVHASLLRLRPDADTLWEHDAAARRAYLQRLRDFSSGLPPAWNSLKAHVLYRVLELDEREDARDKAAFLEYLRLPRQAVYVRREYLGAPDRARVRADLNQDFSAQTALPPVGMDEPLVRRYLMHFLKDAADASEFREYLEEAYLREVFAETKLLQGEGDMEQWFSMLSPEQVQHLKERVDIEFLPANPECFAVDEPVTLDVAIKNVSSLIVKIYHINTANYYRQFDREISTDIDLDGLTANREEVFEYDAPPIRRHVRRFVFDDLNGPGVTVIEFIGNGRSSRALIRKGRLAFTERRGAAGHVFTVYDESNAVLTGATLRLGDNLYAPDERGEITVPYSTRPGPRTIVLEHDGFAARHAFEHLAEEYRFAAGIFVDRESLLAGAETAVLVHPRLSLHAHAVDVALIEEPTLFIESTDLDGTVTSTEIRDFALHDDRESLHAFRVSPRLARLRFTVRGKVRSLTGDRDVPVSDSASFAVNGIDAVDRVECLHLRSTAGGYLLELRGKAGEPRAGRPVHLELKHADFTDPAAATLQSDDGGRVWLGALERIERIQSRGPEGSALTWQPATARHSYPAAIHAAEEDPVFVPWMRSAGEAEDGVSLLELRAGVFAHDRGDAVTVRDGFLEIRGLAPGDYDLRLAREDAGILIRVAAGPRRGAAALSRDRALALYRQRPLQIAPLPPAPDGGGTLDIRVLHAGPGARVHVLATRYLPFFDAFERLGPPSAPDLNVWHLGRPLCRYLSGRNIGDEYRYILERKYAQRFPGAMFARPSLILNPWSLRATETGRQEVEAGAAWEREARRPGAAAAMLRAAGDEDAPAPEEGDFATLDFLDAPSLLLANLRPDEDGWIRVERALLGSRQQVHVLALDHHDLAYRTLSLPVESDDVFRDLCLRDPLDTGQAFSQQKRMSVLFPGQTLTVPDAAAARIEIYDSVAGLYGLLSTLCEDARAEDFRFVAQWPELDADRRRELYSKHACHELNVFLYHKDPGFFRSVIRPYLAHKKDKTFLDHWLLESDLASFLKPWRFGRLNAAERILLGRRLPAQRASIERLTTDLHDAVPPDPERFERLFRAALLGRALDPGAVPIAAEETALDARALAVAAGRGAFAADSARRRPAAPAVAEAETVDRAVKAGMMDGQMLNDRRKDVERRQAVRRLYRRLDTTEEWVENQYYKLPIEFQTADLIGVNAFWRAYAGADPGTPFLSGHIIECHASFAEMMLALSVLDVPFAAAEHDVRRENGGLTVTAGSPAIVFHEEIRPARVPPLSDPILVSQNFFAPDDRYRYENNERLDKFVVEEFLAGRVYGAQIILTNPTSARRKVRILLQIPEGAMPVRGAHATRGVQVTLEPYAAHRTEFFFYFPRPGVFAHYPVHVAVEDELLAAAGPFTFRVVEQPSRVDETSWAHLSQYGDGRAVLDHLAERNLERLDLARIAFRMRDPAFFRACLDLLRERHVFHATLWSYGLYHGDADAIREYLPATDYPDRCGLYIDTPLLTLDPVARHAYQHREYWPLVNARAHPLGRRRRILNREFHEQYMQFLAFLQYRPGLDDGDRMAAAVYLLLQDRVEQSLAMFDAVDPAPLATRLQYDYLQAYLAFLQGDLDRVRAAAAPHADHPVLRWRRRFGEMLAQLDEIEGRTHASATTDPDDRTRIHTRLAETEPALELTVGNREIRIDYRNLQTARINYYLMDIELLFSRSPFVHEVSGQFTVIQPNASHALDLPAGETRVTLPVPEAFADRNVMVEVAAAGLSRFASSTPHSMNVQVIDRYGQLHVTRADTGRPLPRVYVKVYARFQDGRIAFYKDGYTDLRGRFDYASLSTNDIEFVERFSLLVMSDEHGAVVREAAPPGM